MPEQTPSPELQPVGERVLAAVNDLYRKTIDGLLGPDIRFPLTDRKLPMVTITIPTLGLLLSKIGDATVGGSEGKWNGLIAGSILGLGIPFMQWYGSEIAPAISDEILQMSDFILKLPKTIFNKFRSDE